jgi:uncharacterized coiled-coil protein SlyX
MKPSMKIKTTPRLQRPACIADVAGRRSTAGRTPSLLILFALGCLAISHRAQAVSPAPDGGYPGGNTAEGQNALFSITTGGNNTGAGWFSLKSDTTGSFNTGIGVALGYGAGSNTTTGSNNVYIGAGMQGVAGESNACYMASIFGQTSASGIPVLINSGGKLGTTTSSRRFKEDIKSMDNASDVVLALKPVTFGYNKDIDPHGVPQFGLLAEDVEKVNPDLIVRDGEGKPYGVRYDQVNAMLLNEFPKEDRKVEEQQATITQLISDSATQEATIAQLRSTMAQQQKGMEVVTKRLKEQAAQIQKVSAQVELGKPAAQTAVNGP